MYALSTLMVTFISHSPAETEKLGETWGRAAKAPCVIGLSGDLGAGKTQLVKGLARGLGVEERIHSPTFALLSEYHGGRLSLFHMDFYRLETREEILGAGLGEMILNPPGVVVVEWIGRWGLEDFKLSGVVLFRSVKMEVLGEMEREISYEDFGH